MVCIQILSFLLSFYWTGFFPLLTNGPALASLLLPTYNPTSHPGPAAARRTPDRRRARPTPGPLPTSPCFTSSLEPAPSRINIGLRVFQILIFTSFSIRAVIFLSHLPFCLLSHIIIFRGSAIVQSTTYSDLSFPDYTTSSISVYFPVRRVTAHSTCNFISILLLLSLISGLLYGYN